MHNCTFYIYFLIINFHIFRHCRHLQWSYNKIPLQHTTINTNHFISIITNYFNKLIKNIAYILEDCTSFRSTMDICGDEKAVTVLHLSVIPTHNLCYRCINSATLYCTYFIIVTTIWTIGLQKMYVLYNICIVYFNWIMVEDPRRWCQFRNM